MPKTLSKPLGHSQITDLSAAVGLTSPPDKATVAVLCARDQVVNYRDDGTSPTATVGIQLQIGVPFIYDGDLSAIKFIQSAASAKLDVAYYGTE